MAITISKAAEIYERKYPKIDIKMISESDDWFIFSDGGWSDPIGVSKTTGECRGIIPAIDVENPDSIRVVMDKRGS